MKEYDVYFSFYSEQYGRFDDQRISVEAENQFAAVKKAWENIDGNDNFQFTSCVKLCGVMWKASPLDMQDWLNAEASYHKYELQKIENVKKPNAEIEGNNNELKSCDMERVGHISSLFTINNMASDFGRPHGMQPPSIHTELHYAREFLHTITDWEQFSAFQKKIERAEKWDSAAMMDFRDSLRYGLFSADEYTFNFDGQLDKGGLCPIYANQNEKEYSIIQRWKMGAEIKSLDRLQAYGKTDVIADSHTMQYDYQTLVVKMDALPSEKQTPINSLWIANIPDGDGRCEADNGGYITVENAITGQIDEFHRDDFHGVIRPEKDVKINYDAIKTEYQALNAERSNEKTDRPTATEKTADNGKTSILADVQKKQKEISESNPPSGDKKDEKKKDVLS